MLSSKCIKAPRGPEDGRRISIMSRHTLDDGITPDQGIAPESYDEWWKELAPDEKKLGLYLRGEIPFSSFVAGYRWRLFHEDATYEAINRLIDLARNENVTVLCVEASSARCHRRILLEACSVMAPDLRISIL